MIHRAKQPTDPKASRHPSIHARRSRLFFAVSFLIVLTLVAFRANTGSGAEARTPSLLLLNRVMQLLHYDTIGYNGYERDVLITRQACGFTITLQRVYADINQVVIAYIVTGPSGRSFIGALGANPTSATSPRVSTTQGLTLLYLKGAVYTDPILHKDGAIIAFDAAKVQTTSRQLTIRLTFPVLTTVEQWEGTPPRPTPCETARPFRPREAPPGWDYKRMRWLTVRGPFMFDVAMPFAPGHTVAFHRLAHVGRTTLALERLAVSATETRLYIRGIPPALEDRSYATLSLGGKEIQGGSM